MLLSSYYFEKQASIKGAPKSGFLTKLAGWASADRATRSLGTQPNRTSMFGIEQPKAPSRLKNDLPQGKRGGGVIVNTTQSNPAAAQAPAPAPAAAAKSVTKNGKRYGKLVLKPKAAPPAPAAPAAAEGWLSKTWKTPLGKAGLIGGGLYLGSKLLSNNNGRRETS